MRRLLLTAMMFGTAAGAQAADMPDFLRGGFAPTPAPRAIWQGYYVGGQAGYGSSDEKFTGSNSAMTAGLLANTLIETEMGVSSWPLGFKNQSAHVSGYGAFGGYNSQWDDVVVGLEMSYLHGKFGGASQGSMARYSLLSDNNYHSVTSFSSSSIAIQDIGTFRARAGYVINNFLPYMFGGFALGQANLVRSVRVDDFVTAGPGSTTPASLLGAITPLTAQDGKYGHLIYGYTAGIGVDIMLMAGLFVRAEYEYIRFTTPVDTNISTGRVGLGYKF